MNKSVNAALHVIGCQGKVSLFMLALLIGFAGKETLSIRAERPWKTWRQGRTHTKIDRGRNCEKLWRVLDNLDASDTNKHLL